MIYMSSMIVRSDLPSIKHSTVYLLPSDPYKQLANVA